MHDNNNNNNNLKDVVDKKEQLIQIWTAALWSNTKIKLRYVISFNTYSMNSSLSLYKTTFHSAKIWEKKLTFTTNRKLNGDRACVRDSERERKIARICHLCIHCTASKTAANLSSNFVHST